MQTCLTLSKWAIAQGAQKPQVHCMSVDFGQVINCRLVQEFAPLKYNINKGRPVAMSCRGTLCQHEVFKSAFKLLRLNSVYSH